MTILVVFSGPAGSGKTTLVSKYAEWLVKEAGMHPAIVNLDPGALRLPYKPVFDIRWKYTLQEIMDKHGLGPNGAFLKASELMAGELEDIFSRPPFSNMDEWDMILIDTPGQMEAFIFRPISNLFFESLTRLGSPVMVFIIDASAIRTIPDAVTLWFLSVLTQAKTGIVVVPVINKIDIGREGLAYARMIVEDPSRLIHIAEEKSHEGILSEVVPELVSIALKTKGAFRPVMISARTGEGMEDLHYLIHEAFCTCGDLT